MLRSAGNSDNTNEIEVQFRTREVNGLNVSIIPNPNNGLFILTLNIEMINKLCFVNIKNLFGSNLKEITFSGNKATIDASNFSKGIYLVEVIADNKRVTNKLIIN